MKINKKELSIIVLFFCVFLNISYSNDKNTSPLLPYDVGDESSIRDEEILKRYIEETVDKKERLYFRNPEEVQYAQQFNYVSVDTGEILYKSKKHCCAGM